MTISSFSSLISLSYCPLPFSVSIVPSNISVFAMIDVSSEKWAGPVLIPSYLENDRLRTLCHERF